MLRNTGLRGSIPGWVWARNMRLTLLLLLSVEKERQDEGRML